MEIFIIITLIMAERVFPDGSWNVDDLLKIDDEAMTTYTDKKMIEISLSVPDCGYRTKSKN